MHYLFSLTLLSLFLPIRLYIDNVLLRPFELLTLLTFIYIGISRQSQHIVLPRGLLLLLPFLSWHVISAGTMSVENALREGLQAGVVMLFAVVLVQVKSHTNIVRSIMFIMWGMAAVLFYTIIWHLENGYWVGWKQLTDTRLSFVFLPVVIGGLILFAKHAALRTLWLFWIGLLPILVMSGERKALLIQLLLMVLLLSRGRVTLIAAGVAIGFTSLFILSTMLDDPYLQRQVRSIIDPASTGHYEYAIITGRYMPGDSLSNVQRAFAYALSSKMIAEKPMVGVGTNQYVNIVNQWYPDLPEEMRLGIHGEFQRVLTENGVIGLSLYLLIWIVSWNRLQKIINHSAKNHVISMKHARILPLLIFVPCALFVGTEASGTRSFIVLVFISLLPELLKAAICRSEAPLMPVKALHGWLGSRVLRRCI